MDGRFAAGILLIRALRDFLLATYAYVSCLGPNDCLNCESAGVREGAPSPKTQTSFLYCIGDFAV